MGKLQDIRKRQDDKTKRSISNSRPMKTIKNKDVSNNINKIENKKESIIPTKSVQETIDKENIKGTNKKQLKSKNRTENFKVVTSAAYTKLSKQKNELIAEFEVISNTGIGKRFLLKYCFEPCLKRGVDTTEPISIISIAKLEKYKSRDVLQVTINRLEKKGIIRNIYGRRGRKGFSVYQVNPVALKAYERLKNSNNPYCSLEEN